MDVGKINYLRFNDNALEFITERFNQSIYSTWADLVLISLNPFISNEVDPETDARLKEHLKTYSLQKALKFLADKDTPLGEIHYSLTLLSAFGNAGTEYHSDSSRFGKLLSLGYNEYSDKLLSASFQTYLLEKTRVSSPTIRNFHIFYQVLSTSIISEKYHLFLNPSSNYKIIPGKPLSKDRTAFGNTLEALRILKFDPSFVKGILSIISCILHLGNISFVMNDNGKCCVNTSCSDSLLGLKYASNLLGLECVVIQELLTHIIISPDSQKSNRRHTLCQIHVPSLEDACARRDALIKTLYLLLFNWIVSTINNSFHKCLSEGSYKLGLLDIYGFEMFTKNSLEQLCINYANERLHSFFIQDVLLQKKMMLMNEGFLIEKAPKLEEQFFKDANARIAILDAPFSVIGIINEGSLLGRHAGGKDLCQRISSLPSNKFIANIFYDQKFVFSHFAGAVKYDARHIVEKNSDKVPGELLDILSTGKNEFLAKLISIELANTSKHTVLGKFKNSLDKLMKQLKSSQIHYVRCIKPNMQMKPCYVDKHFLEKQLKTSGLFEAIKLCGHSFPVRLTFKEFFSHFHKLIGTFDIQQHEYCNEKFQRKVILKWTSDIDIPCQVGDKSVFLNEDVFITLEAKRQFLRNHSARVIQKFLRKRTFLKKNNAAKIIQHYLKNWILEKKSSCLEISNLDKREGIGSSIQLLNNYQDGNCTISASVSVTETSRCLSRGDNSKLFLDTGDDLMSRKNVLVFSQNLVVTDKGTGDNAFINFDFKRMNEEKVDLMLNWLNKIPLSSNNSVNTQITEVSFLNNSIKHTYEIQKPLQSKKYREQSELYSVANKSYPVTEKGYSCHYLKKIVISEKVVGRETFFVGNGVVSRRSLAKVPMWFHTRKTCLRYSCNLPHSLLTNGLEDLLT
ncbi:unconventional myosin-XIX-like isoform X2 [Lycorma delicatula]|uniref:unconventional myosin-XIX-like isoform X2 n=1 Tax=Lycorma delicatula TaxID=130591 RepID=UPI003F517C68